MTLLLTIVYALLASILGPPLVTIVGSLTIGCVLALVDLGHTLVEEHRSITYRLYVLDRGWHVIYAIATHLFAWADSMAAQWHDHAATVRYLAFTRVRVLTYPAWLIIIALRCVARLFYLQAMIIATMFTIFYTPLLIVFLLVTLIILTLLATLSKLADLYAYVNRLACACPGCYRETYTPVFLCPTCKTACPRLRPGLQGVLFQRCTGCQRRLPTLNILRHRRLERTCPHCQSPFPSVLGTAPTTHIALIGGVASGKTTSLLNSLAPLLKQSRISFVDPELQQPFEQAIQQLSSGEAPTMTSTVALRPLMLRLRSPRTLLYLYDPPGKDFTSGERVLQHAYYKQTNGLLFIIDPLAIPTFYRRYQANVAQSVPEQPGEPNIERVYARMMRAFEILIGLHPGQPYPQSIAVVVTRVDLLHLACEHDPFATPTLTQPSSPCAATTQHQFVRSFLCHNDLENMLRDLEAHFRHVRYFASSASENNASGSQEALKWLLEKALR